MRRLAAAHGVSPASCGIVGAAWLVAAGAAHIGIPRIDPALEHVARPLETLAFVVMLLPVSLLASLLADEAPWLTSTAPRWAAGLRLRWASVLTVVAIAAGIAWVATLPVTAPRGQSLAGWSLAYGLAMWSAVLLRADLAALIPLIVVAPLSIGGVVPFEANVLYNVRLAEPAAWAASIVLVSGVVAYALLGDARARRDG